jgi:heat shock protein HtpX
VNEQVAQHRRRALALVAEVGIVAGVVVALLLVLVGVGALVAALVAVVAAAAVAALAWRRAEPAVLRAVGAVPADPEVHARLHNLVEGLCVSVGLPKPQVLVVDDPARNALVAAASPGQAALVVTTGLVDALTRVELEAVVARLLGSVRDGSAVPATVAVTTVGALTLVGDRAVARAGGSGELPALARLAYAGASLQARLLHAAVGEQADGLADRAAVGLTRYPPGLESALAKLAEGGTVVRRAGLATAHLWLAVPVDVSAPGARGELARRFDRHAPLTERIETLREY